MDAPGPLLASGSPLMQELQQGRKMQSLDELMLRLDDDHTRHVAHAGVGHPGAGLPVHAAHVPTAAVLASAGPASGAAPAAPPHPAGPTADLPTAALGGATPPAKRASYPELIRGQVSAARDAEAGGTHAPAAVEGGQATRPEPLLDVAVADAGAAVPAACLSPVPPSRPRDSPARPRPAREGVVAVGPATPSAGEKPAAEKPAAEEAAEGRGGGDHAAAPTEGQLDKDQGVEACKAAGAAEEGESPTAAAAGDAASASTDTPTGADRDSSPGPTAARSSGAPAVSIQLPGPADEAGSEDDDEGSDSPDSPTEWKGGRSAIIEVGTASCGFEIRVQQAGRDALRPALAERIAARRSIAHTPWLASQLLGVVLEQVRIRLPEDRGSRLLQHDDEVMSLDFSTDGLRLIAGSEDGRLVLWDVAAGERLAEASLELQVVAVAYAPSGRYITAGLAEGVVSVWGPDLKAEVGRETVAGTVRSVALTSRSFDILAVGTTAKKVVLFSVPELEEIAELRHDGHVNALCFSPCGSMLAGGGGTDEMHGLFTKKVAGRDMKTVIWQISARGNRCKYLGSVLFEDIVHAASFAPSGKLLAVTGEYRMIAVLLVDRQFEKAAELPCMAGVRCLAWSPSSRFLASAGEDMQVSIWDVLAEKVVLQLPKASDWLCGVRFNKAGTLLACCGFGTHGVSLHAVEVVRVEGGGASSSSALATGEETPSPASTPRRGPPSLLGRTGSKESTRQGSAASCSGVELTLTPTRRPSALETHDMRALKSAGTVKFSTGQSPSARSIAIPNVVDLGGSGEGFRLRIEQVDTSAPPPEAPSLIMRLGGRRSIISMVLGVADSPALPRQCPRRQAVQLQHKDEVMSLAFSPDGKRVVAAGEDATVVVWNVADQARVMEARVNATVLAVVYSPSGRYFAASDADSVVTVWGAADDDDAGEDPNSLEELRHLELEGQACCLAMSSRSGELLAAGTNARKVILLSVPELDQLADLRHDGHVRSVAFSPDGGLLAGGGGIDEMHGLMTHKVQGHETKAVVWQVGGVGGSYKYLGAISFSDVVHATSFAPSGKLLAVAGESRVIATLLVERDFEKASELQCTAGIRCLGWSSDSRFLASGGEDLQVSVWDVVAERVVFQLPKGTDWICSVAFSPDTRWLASCGFGSTSVALVPIMCGDEEEPVEQAGAADQEEEEEEEEEDGGLTDDEDPARAARAPVEKVAVATWSVTEVHTVPSPAAP